MILLRLWHIKPAPIKKLSASNQTLEMTNNEFDFLKAKVGDVVATDQDEIVKIISGVEGARDPDVNTLFQVVVIDTGVIKYINPDEITGIVKSMT